MDTTCIGAGQRLGRTVDIGIHGSGQTAHDTVLNGIGDQFDRLKVTGTRDCKTGLDDIDAQLLQRTSNAQLLVLGHGRAGALLPVTQCGIEDDYLILCHTCSPLPWSRHRVTLSR